MDGIFGFTTECHRHAMPIAAPGEDLIDREIADKGVVRVVDGTVDG